MLLALLILQQLLTGLAGPFNRESSVKADGRLTGNLLKNLELKGSVLGSRAVGIKRFNLKQLLWHNGMPQKG